MNKGLSQLGVRTTTPPIAWLMEAALERPHLISLAAGFTDNPTLPRETTREILAHLLADTDQGTAALQYGTTAGDPNLRRLAADRLRELDRPDPQTAAHYSAERVLITNGSQQFLYLATECLCDPGDIVLVEDPTYFVYLGIAQSHGLCCRGVPMDGDGVDLDALAATLHALKKSGDLPRVKALYLVTYCQNPTGATTLFLRKRAALEILRSFESDASHPIYLIEDAAYRELSFSSKADESTLWSTPEAADRVLVTGTFSKPFATGIRVGYGMTPKSLHDVLKRVKSNHDFGTSHLLQHILARALEGRHYRDHVARLVRRYQEKAGWMRSALRAHFPAAVQWREPDGGLYFWARLPAQIPTGMNSQFFQAALDAGVLYVPGAICYAEDPTRPRPDNEMRLSFGNASEEQIREGIARLGTVIHSFLP